MTEMETRLNKFLKQTDNYVTLQQMARDMRQRINHLTHLPMGHSVGKRKLQCVDVLAKKGGALKRRVQKTRFDHAFLGFTIEFTLVRDFSVFVFPGLLPALF